MRTIEDLMAALFPRGTAFPAFAGLEPEGIDRVATFDPVPLWPPDLFAIVGKLLDLSGAYHHVVQTTVPAMTDPRPRCLEIRPAFRDGAVDVGARWAGLLRRKRSVPNLAAPPREVAVVWAALRARAVEPVFVECGLYDDSPAWWGDAYWLMMVADEASRDIGFDPDTTGRDPTNTLETFLDIIRYSRTTNLGPMASDNFYSCSFAEPNVVCVMPKSRTPAVGCTMRSLSHNLALTPPGGEVRIRWLSPHAADPVPPDHPLKVLLVPYPYDVEAECFETVAIAGTGPGTAPWGWFHISPRWLGDDVEPGRSMRAAEFADFVVSLVEEAGREGPPVGAVILPEAALDEFFFTRLLTQVMTRCPNVETLVSGLSEAPDGAGRTRKGNFVTQVVFPLSRGKRQAVRTIREKHHRWRLDRSQIEIYDLAAQLNPSTLWWEGISITGRSVDVVALREGATMTTLICEDLARVDPCQVGVRSVGPTLLVALLMDGSQLAYRWPGRYATVLAEDPGCSVLTVSSLGLINRTRLADGSRPKWSIALWRDDENGPNEIVLKPGHHAVSLTLRPDWRTECSLDGRHDDGQALAWRLDGDDVVAKRKGPRSVKAPGPPPAWIVKGTV